MIDKLTYIRAQLGWHKGELNKVAYESGVGRRTITYITHPDYVPTLRTINLLYKYLKKMEGK